jgi:CDP-paratose 2-epimerase
MYGASKLCSELILQEYVEMYDMPGLINRCGVLTGPWQMGKVDQGVVVLWAARHLYGGALSYIGYGGEGKQVRDILHVNDLLNLLIYQIDNLDSVSGELFNVGGGRDISISLQELTTLCEKHTGNSIEIDSVGETRDADIPLYITDNAYATESTGWRPQISSDKIVEEIVEWLREHEFVLRPILG